jgi:glutathione S-transferase
MTLDYSSIEVELREVLLRDKPRAMLEASPKGTVPVLVLSDGRVIDESVDVMHWALMHRDPDAWKRKALESETNELVEQNDFEFKKYLDRYKYADRYPEHPRSFYRTRAEDFLRLLEQKLATRQYLLAGQLTFADVAVFPFIRQFAFVDKTWFDQAPYPRLQAWLQHFLDSDLFLAVMTKFPRWQEDQADE